MGYRENMNDEERELAKKLTRNSWHGAVYGHQQHDEDIISMPCCHPAQRGRESILAWYAKRKNGVMNLQMDVNTCDIVGDVAVVVATFRVTRNPQEGVAGVDHGGNWLAVLKRVDGEWKMWRDMDNVSPDADHWYTDLRRDRW